LTIYPEYRKYFNSTTSKTLYNFNEIFSYKIIKDDKLVKEYKDSLTPIQKMMLDLFDMYEEQYWGMVVTGM